MKKTSMLMLIIFPAAIISFSACGRNRMPVTPVINTATVTMTAADSATPISIADTNTATPQATATPSQTHTSTQTATFLPSGTGTPADTLTQTPAATLTFTETLVPSATDTQVPTATSSPQNTATGTQVASATETATRTSSPTYTPTCSPTFTRTGTPTFTRTVTPSWTRTSSPSNTATSTPTFSHTLTATGTQSFTATLNPTSSASPTLTGTFTPADSATATGTYTTTASSTYAGSPTDSPTATQTATLAPAWETIGSGISTGVATDIAIHAYNGELYVTYEDAGLGGLAVKKYNGAWSDTGAQPLIVANIKDTSIQVDPGTIHSAGDVYVAFTDNTSGQTQKIFHYNGVSWSAHTYAGTTVTSYAAEFGDLYIFGSDMYYSYRLDSSPTMARVLKWTGNGASGWEHPGGVTNVYLDSATWPELSGAGGNLYMAFRGDTMADNGECLVKYWNGSTWQNLGTSLNGDLSTYQSIYAVSTNEIYVVYMDWQSPNSGMTVSKWNGSAWSVMGSRGGLSAGTISYTSMQYYGGRPIAAAADGGASNAVKVLEWTGSAWQLLGGESPGTTDAGIGYNDVFVDNTGGYCYTAFADASNGFKLTVKRHKF